jgi:hypothetical protein
MNSSNIGAVKPVSPWLGPQIIPLEISELRVGSREVNAVVHCNGVYIHLVQMAFLGQDS